VAGLLLALALPAVPAKADAVRDGEWHLAFLDMARVHQVSQGDGVTVAVIDDGINGNHPDLVGNVLPGLSLLPSHPGNGWDDVDAHGTAMAGLIAGHGRNGGGDGVLGIAPRAKILPIQTMSGADPGTSEMDGAAVEAAVQRGARVISISIGRSLSAALRDAVARAQRADVVIVAGAGNRPDSQVTWPARYDGVVAVAAVDRQGNHADISVTGRQVVIAAPGVDIKAADTGNGYGTGSGTSLSTAVTAGVVALIRAKFPTMPATEVIHRLTATAIDKGPKGRDDEYGYGIVNPYAALTADIPPLAASSSPTAPATTTATTPPANASPRSGGSRTGVIIAVIAGAAIIATVVVIGLIRRRGAAT